MLGWVVNKKKYFLLILVLVVVFVVWLWKYSGWFDEISILNPLSSEHLESIEKEKYEVVGFLPPWMIDKVNLHPKQLDQLIFLGVGVEENGDLVWDFQAKKINSEKYLIMKKEMRENEKKNVIGVKLFDDEKLSVLLKSKERRRNLIEQIKAMVLSGGFDGVNIDFEYQKDPLAILGTDFLIFLDELKEAEIGEIGVDVFCNTIIKGPVAQISDLLEKVDWLIVMAYDFHRPGVDYTGSVAPIKAGVGERSIWEVVSKLTGLDLDRKKILMAYPLYGYEWKTRTEKLNSEIIRGWYQMASYKRVREMIYDRNYWQAGLGFKIYDLRKSNCDDFRNLNDNEMKLCFDELSLTPWLVFRENEEIHQIYYDDFDSLSIKINLVEEMGFGGTGFWALGYEGEADEIWKIFDKVLK